MPRHTIAYDTSEELYRHIIELLVELLETKDREAGRPVLPTEYYFQQVCGWIADRVEALESEPRQ